MERDKDNPNTYHYVAWNPSWHHCPTGHLALHFLWHFLMLNPTVPPSAPNPPPPVAQDGLLVLSPSCHQKSGGLQRPAFRSGTAPDFHLTGVCPVCRLAWSRLDSCSHVTGIQLLAYLYLLWLFWCGHRQWYVCLLTEEVRLKCLEESICEVEHKRQENMMAWTFVFVRVAFVCSTETFAEIVQACVHVCRQHHACGCTEKWTSTDILIYTICYINSQKTVYNEYMYLPGTVIY